MSSATYDVVGIGNAIVDVIARAEDSFLAAKKLAKGAMMLIDEAQADALYAAMGPGMESSGGSAANTMAGIASLGGKGAFFGKVKEDQLGKVFAHDMRSIGVAFDSAAAKHGPSTARCLILVTPDAQRTMNTYLGACVNLGPDDVDEAVVKASRVTYLEGYLWDPPKAKEAFVKAAKIAHAAGRKVSLSLSDAFCVDRHRAEFRELVAGHVDILFANESEIKSLYEVDGFDAALQAVRGSCEIACLTRSEKGSVIVAGEEVHVIDAERVGPDGAQVVDTTGAGDLYAAGFLFGWTHGYGLARAGRIASIAAAEAISHVGARPQTSLKELVKQKLG
ncbi:MAG: adenosine kinase [Rhodospirillaceae bacterium]|nr:adenosine kinase [Rhodospirillaceae bacterium]